MRTRTIASEQEFADLREGWRDLLDNAIDANTFLSHDWLHTWWRAYRPRAELRILVVEDSGRPVAIAPMMVERAWRGGLPCRVLRFIGDGTYETDHMNFLVDARVSGAVFETLLEGLAALPWDVAHLNQMPEASSLTERTLAYARAARWSIDLQPVPCPKRTLPASYEALLASMPSRFRTSLRSSRRKLMEKYRVEFGLHEEERELPQALDTLFANHASRWQAKGQQGVFVDERKRRLYAELTPLLHRRGELRFFYLKLDGRIVAQEYCFEHRGVVLLLQEGFDFAHAAENVGNALRGLIFEHLIGRGVVVYDFLAGTSRHKANWSDSAPADLRIELARHSVRGAVAFHAPRLTARLRRRFRRKMAFDGAADSTARGADPTGD